MDLHPYDTERHDTTRHDICGVCAFKFATLGLRRLCF
jgi:hypothetical protein